MVKITCALRYSSSGQKRKTFYVLFAGAAMFASFICLCGITHLLSIVHFFYPSSASVSVLRLVMLVLAALVSVITAMVCSKLFPIILDNLGNFEFSSEGNIQHTENYLIEVVEMVKESIIVLSEDFEIVRCNEASKVLLGASKCINRNYKDFIHPQDMRVFQDAVSRVMGHYSMTPVTIEYRVNRPVSVQGSGRVKPVRGELPSFLTSSNKIHIDSVPTEKSDKSSPHSFHSTPGGASGAVHAFKLANPSLHSGGSSPSTPPLVFEGFTWIETTICKGMRLNHEGDFEYDLKLVSRNIDDRKRDALREYNDIVKDNEESARTNAAKLRYISCIAHDLKTPLQSFCFTLDLLNQTNMHREQREFVQQANVAVDLMRLTISQTMDISKALTGAKLMPRRTTVYLSSIMHRVEVIM